MLKYRLIIILAQYLYLLYYMCTHIVYFGKIANIKWHILVSKPFFDESWSQNDVRIDRRI